MNAHRWINAFGGGITAAALALTWFSHSLDPTAIASEVILVLVCIAVQCIAYCGAIALLYRNPLSLKAILFWAVAMRLVLCFSQPIYETDYNRYLWDGYLITQGVSPYTYAPSEWLPLEAESPDPVLDAIRQNIVENHLHIADALAEINHPEVRTIYPPFVQLGFALSAFIAPGSLWVWRLVVLLADAALIVAIMMLLQHFKRPLAWVLVYAWSPLVLKESINTTHIDVIMLAAFFGSLVCLIKQKPIGAGLLFASSILTKWATLVLFPLLAFSLGWRGVLSCIAAIVCLVFIVGGVGGGGMTLFAHSWESNSSAVLVLEAVLERIGVPVWGEGSPITTVFGYEWALDAFVLARGFGVLAVIICVTMIAYRNRSRPMDAYRLIPDCMMTIGVVLMASPVCNPWYVMWIVPFLCFVPYASWLYLSMSCMLYYVYFIPEPRAYVPGIWEAQYIPFALLLLYEWRYGSLLKNRIENAPTDQDTEAR